MMQKKKKMREHKKIGKKESNSGVFFLFNFFCALAGRRCRRSWPEWCAVAKSTQLKWSIAISIRDSLRVSVSVCCARLQLCVCVENCNMRCCMKCRQKRIETAKRPSHSNSKCCRFRWHPANQWISFHVCHSRILLRSSRPRTEKMAFWHFGSQWHFLFARMMCAVCAHTMRKTWHTNRENRDVDVDGDTAAASSQYRALE